MRSFIIVNFNNYYSGDQIKENKMAEHVAPMEEMRNE
jgi:hypothetical protein